MDQQPPLPLIALRASDEFAPCVDYVLRLFALNSGFVLRTPALEEPASRRGQDLCLVYGRTAEDCRAVLERFQIPEERAVAIARSGFFGPGFLANPQLPEEPKQLLAAARPGALRGLQAVSAPGSLRFLPLDLIAASFWFLSRYEETVTAPRDAHGRFLCSMSAAPPEMYDVPVVNRWFEQLRDLLLEPLNLPKAPPDFSPRQTIALTHDVDLMRKYRGLGGMRRALGTAVRSGVSAGMAEIRAAGQVMGGRRRDPYDSFDALFTVKERLSAPSTFFFMGGGSHALDRDYRLEDSDVRTLISRAKAFGDEIGVHPSYGSSASRQVIESEAEAVSRAAGRRVQGSRQHYLRADVPATLRHVADVGLRYDSSLGFPDRAGFRCGWSGCFRPFDVQRREEIPVLEIPLVVMDVTIAIYERIPSELSLERLAQLLDSSETRGGAFVFLWHNTVRDTQVYPGYWETFEYFFSACAGGARYTTLGTLCDEFEAQEQALTGA